MSDAFYKLVCAVCRPPFSVSCSATVLHAERLRSSGGLILAPNHLSPYDIPCLMAASPRPLDFVSIVELFRKPLVGWFFAAMNAFPLDRNHADPAATRLVLRRLREGRVVAMFPEGRICTAADSLLCGGPFKDSVLRLARMARVPIVPAVVLGTGNYARPGAWLPLKRTRFAVGFGHPLHVAADGQQPAVRAEAVGQLRRAYHDLYAELRGASGLTVADAPWRPAAPAATKVG